MRNETQGENGIVSKGIISKLFQSIKRLWYFPISSSAPRPLGAAFVPILLSEVDQEQRPSGNGDRQLIVVGAGLCDGEGERAYTAYAPHYDFFCFQKVPFLKQE